MTEEKQVFVLFLLVFYVMTKPKIPFTCDIHGGEIETEKRYIFEVYDERGSWAKVQTKAENIDVCHKCFLDICKQGYEPKWKSTIKNPKYIKGGAHSYRIPVPETDVRIGQEELKVSA